MKRNYVRVIGAVGILGLCGACSDNSTVAPKPGLAPGAAPAFDLTVPANGSGACMGDDAVTSDSLVSNWTSGLSTATSLNCTSNDISVATATVVGYSFLSADGPFTPLTPGDHISCTPGQTIFAQTSAQLKNSAQDRYNIGVWIANDPTRGVEGSAVTGTCFHFNLIPGLNGSSQKDGDSCGDMNQGAGLASVDLGTLTIVCPAGQAQVTVNNCVGWENSNLVSARGNCPNTDPANTGTAQIGSAQAFRDGTLPETKSKCNCSPFVLPIDVRGTITIVKNTIGGDGSFQFTSDVGSNSSPVVSSPFTIATTNNSGSQLIDNVATGTYHIAESTPPSDFTFTSLSCHADNTFASATVSGQTATITMGKGGVITCTYTNTQKTLLTLAKVVTNDNGGTRTLSDFPLTASGPVTISGASGATAVTARAVSAGSYALSEQTQAGYTASSWSCTGGSQSGTNITLATGNAATCTISNDDNGPTLTLVKTIMNDNGGTKTLSDFPLTATGPIPPSCSPGLISGVSGTASVSGQVLCAGTFALSEQTQSGYTPSSWSCTGGTQSGSNISLGLGGAATCTISNNDVGPTLTLVKTVTNDNGGTKTISDFPLTASGPVTISGVSGSTSVSGRVVNAGSYALTEQTQAGYTPSSWTCSGGTQTGASIALALGGSATCTINNDDSPASLTLVKVVTNNNGGTRTLSDFPLTASGPVTISGVSGTTAVTSRNVSTGSYSLSEQTQAGYTPSSWSCSGGTQSGANIAIALAGSATCTISNDDNGPTLTLVKTITNDNGGTKTLSDFPLTATGPIPPSCSPGLISGVSGTASVSGQVVCAGTFALSEQTQAGYTASSWTCSGGTQSGANVTLALGTSATCTINNNDNPPSLTLVKVVTNNNGGSKTLSDFPLTASGPVTISGVSGTTAVTSRNVSAGSYALTEQTQAGYTPSSWSCSGGTQNGANIAIALAGSATCTISNDDNGPTLTLVKTITNDNGGSKTLSDFPLTASGPVTISGVSGTTSVTSRVVNAGSYALTEQTQTGYAASSWSCSGGTQSGATVALALGGSATCTINNNDNAPALSITKTPDQLGDAGYTVQAPGTAVFTITVSNSSAAGTGTALGVTLTDTLPAGLTWSADNASCTTNGSVTPPKPPGDGLTHQLLSCDIGTMAPGASFTVNVSASVPSSFVQQPPSPAGSAIEIDGNLVDDPAVAGKDWASLPSSIFNCASTPKIGCDLDKPTGTTDDSFGQGTKEDTPTPTVVSGSIPNNKSDLQRFYVSAERFVTNDFLYLGWERVQAPNGTTNMDFELNQSSQLSANGVTPIRMAGDILIKYDLSKGGTVPVLGFHRWVTSGVPSSVCEASNTVPCWGKGTTILTGASAAINTASVTDPILAPGQTSSRTLDALTFGEASIDLQTAGIFQTGVCVNFGQAYLKSRSSDSFTSEIKDFIAPIPVSVTNCAPVIVNNTAWVSATNVTGSTSDGGQIKVTTP